MGNNMYFHIEKEMLKNETIFPFHLFIHNPFKNTYSPFLKANSPLTKEKAAFLSHLVSKGAVISINKKQQLTFTRSMQIKPDRIQSQSKEAVGRNTANNNYTKKLAVKQKQSVELLKKQTKFDVRETVSKSINTDDFSEVIKRAKLEITSFSLSSCHTTSLAVYMADKLLNEDNSLNRIASLSYFLAKILNINDPDVLSTLVCSTFFSHIGMTQIPLKVSRIPYGELNDDGLKFYKIHQGLASHLIRKSKIELDGRSIQIIKDHHERISGTGFPQNKNGDSIDKLSLVLGIVSEFIDYSLGKIEPDVKGVQSSHGYFINNKNTIAREFGGTIYVNFLEMFKTGLFKAVA